MNIADIVKTLDGKLVAGGDNGRTVGAVVALEFAVDKSATISIAAAYLMEALCCAVLGVTVWQTAMKN